jgi:hypothetical protein
MLRASVETGAPRPTTHSRAEPLDRSADDHGGRSPSLKGRLGLSLAIRNGEDLWGAFGSQTAFCHRW